MRTLPLCLLLALPALASKNHDAYTEPGELPRLKVAGEALPLKHTQVFAEIAGPVARVQVVQTYGNPHAEPIEAVYIFPLPENSAVDDMMLRVGDRVVRADIKRRADARKVYEDAKRKGQTAALLEQERPNIFTQSVANIAPGEDIDVTVSYVQRLTYDAGEYEFVFPMVVGPRFVPEGVADGHRINPPTVGKGRRTGHDIALEVVVDAGLPIVDFEAPTHLVDAYEEDDAVLRVALSEGDSLPNRDFVMRYRVDGEETRVSTLAHRDERGGFFTLQVQPPQLDVETLVGRRELIFVVDVSGSMFGVPLAMAKDAMRLALEQTRPVDTFNIYTFAGSTARLFDAPRPANDANLQLAMKFLRDARAGGGTYLAKAVDAALSPEVEAGRHRYVFFLTDGYVGNEKRIFAGARKLVRSLKRAGQRARVFSLGVGSSVNRHLLDGLAKAGKGVAVYVTNREEPARAVNRFYRTIDHPVLSDIRIDWGGLDVESTYPSEVPDLFATRPLVIKGRYGAPGTGTVTVYGRANGRDVVIPVEVELPETTEHRQGLASLWARARVADLSRRLWSGHDSDAIAQITQTGLEFRLVTAYTSFVAVDRSRSVGDGSPKTIVQPVEAPEAVDMVKAGALGAMMGTSGLGHGTGGLGLRGSGYGGGGAGYGRGMMGEKKEEKVAVRGKVSHSAATVMGSLDPAVVQRVVRRHRNEVRAAYEKSLKASPALQGKLVLQITIEDGKVTKVEVTGTTLNDTALEKALVRIVKRWRFPRFPGGGQVVISYPFIFSPR